MIEMKTQLDQLKEMSTVVADTGEFNEIRQYRPTSGTTNPSLILAASKKEEYQHLIQEAILWGKQGKTRKEKLELTLDKLFINFGIEILKIIPGEVSTEVDARLSFDVRSLIKKARHLIALYEAAGIERKRILIKLASTWEGIMAAKQLEKESIRCNMTLLFSLHQAVACAKVRATLISPFVGRVLDWHKKHESAGLYIASQDPGVKLVTSIYQYYKHEGIPTKIMAASFRNIDEILELAGCDLLTIAPHLLKELLVSNQPISLKLSPEAAKNIKIGKVTMSEKKFRWALCENQMASDKLYEGIRGFSQAMEELETTIAYHANLHQ